MKSEIYHRVICFCALKQIFDVLPCKNIPTISPYTTDPYYVQWTPKHYLGVFRSVIHNSLNCKLLMYSICE